MGRDDTLARLETEFGIKCSLNARVLPKGSIKKMRAHASTSSVVAEALPVESDHESTLEFEWVPPGHIRDVSSISFDEICAVHQALVRDFASSGDPIEPSGIRDANLLHSAAARPTTSLGQTMKYATLESYAAALLHSLVNNHAFFNGNKRTALVSMMVLLDRNNVLLTCTEQQLFKHVLMVSQHRLVPAGSSQRADREVTEIAHWICANSRPIMRGERHLKWREIRAKFVKLGCEVGPPLPGNKVKIARVVNEKVLGITVRRKLRVTVGRRNDGTEVDPPTLRHIRKSLRLDDASGYDSGYFYGSDAREPDEFIAQYRTLLRRLARL